MHFWKSGSQYSKENSSIPLALKDRCDVGWRRHATDPANKLNAELWVILLSFMELYHSVPTAANRQLNAYRTNLPGLHPGAQGDFKRPGRTMLSVEVKISLRDVVRVGKVVANIGADETMRSGTALLPPTDRSIDRNLSDVNTLWHKFAC